MNPDRPTRFSADLLESAAVEAKRESRSTKQQLDYWTRLGRSVSMHQTAGRRRVEAALTGNLRLSELSDEERMVANAELDVAIQIRAKGVSFGTNLAGAGVTTVALDDDGRLVEYRPDGSSSVLSVLDHVE